MRRNAQPQFSTRQDGPGGRAMDEESRRERILPGRSRPFRKGRRDPRAAGKPRLKPARSKEEPAPWSPKESPSPPGPGLRPKLGVGLGGMRTIKKAYSEFRSKPPAQALNGDN
jgi:hypothetical protein